MKKLILLFITAFFFSLCADQDAVISEIKKYSGENSKGLIKLYLQDKNLEYNRFIIENSSPNDLAVLTAEYIEKNIEYALKTKELKYSSLYDEEIFKHFVLPLRSSQEPFEDWRERFYEELYPKVKDIEDIEKAAIIVNLWAEEQMTYKPTHGRDQGPLTTIKRGFGRCEEMMIIYMSAARSVGIPVRSAGAPFWNFTNSNHAWVEVWTPEGWKYLGEPADRLNKTWFTKTTKRSSIITSRAFGYYDGEDILEQKNGSTTISSIKYYTDKYDKCRIIIDDGKGMPVDDAVVRIYGVSWGGLFPMLELETGSYGMIELPLGRGSVFVTAYHETAGTGYSLFDTLEGGKDIRIELNPSVKDINADLHFKFRLAESAPAETGDERSYFKDDFKMMKENASLKRKNRLNENKKTPEFAKFFRSEHKPGTDKYYEELEEFLKKCEITGENTAEFLKVFESFDPEKNENDIITQKILCSIIKEWDDKELCEIPDSSAIASVAKIYTEGKLKYKKMIPDSVFTSGVIAPTWKSSQPPQTGWQSGLYNIVKDLRSSNIRTTVKDAVDWADSKLSTDSSFVYHYYSASLDPMQIMNMHSVPPFYRIKLINNTLKILGVPVKWKGSLHYYNGKKFLPVERTDDKDKDEESAEKELRLMVFADGEKIKAEPWENFMLAEFSEGDISYTYFDGENDSLDFMLKYIPDTLKTLCIESGIRNSNGDANVAVRTLTQNEDTLRIDLTTPREYLDVSADLGKENEKLIKDFASGFVHDGCSILLIRGAISNEPTKRMTSQLYENSEKFAEKNCKLYIYTEIRNDNDLEEKKNIKKIKGDILIPEVADRNYPLVFLMNKEKKIIFASRGYNMGIAKLLLKKIKN